MRTYTTFLVRTDNSQSLGCYKPMAQLSLSLFFLLLSSCVSVNLGAGKSEKAADISFSEPTAPYTSSKDSVSDRLWTSSKTGNSISYLSECTLKSDPSLEVLQNDYTSVLKNSEVVKSEFVRFNQREGIRFQSKGTLDGIAVKFESLIFKKNNCNYTLTYGGREKSFENEKKHFDQFLQDFVVP